MLTFNNATKSGINQGIASSIFCTSLIFVALWFLVRHAQKLMIWDYLGILMVIICVVLISLSGDPNKPNDNSDSDSNKDDKTIEKVLTIVFALCTGLILAVNSIDIFSCMSYGIDGNQMNVDGFFVKSFILVPFFAYE